MLKDYFGGGLRCIGSMLPMQRGELGRRHSAATAVRPDLVVVLPPRGDGGPGLRQRLEPMFIQAFIPELAVEALDVTVLHRPAWLNRDVANPVGLRPSHEGAAGKFRSVVGTYRARITTKDGRPI